MPKGGCKGGANATVLNYLAAMKSKYDINEVDKTKLGALAKIKGASTLRKALAYHKQNGNIEVVGKMVSITKKGMDEADTTEFDNIKIATTNDEKHEQVKEGLKKKQIELFDAMKDGRVYAKETLRLKLNMENNSTWRKLLASLVNLKIAEYYPDSKSIRLTDGMFPVVPRLED